MERKNDLQWKCFCCGETEHLVKSCPWKNYPCVADGCQEKMDLYWSRQKQSDGCRFLRCRAQPHYGAFLWIDVLKKLKEVSETTSSQGEGSGHVKVTMEEKGKRVTFEGNVDDVIELVKNKLM